MYTLAMGYDNMHRIKSKSQHLTQDNVQFNGTLNAGYDLSYTYGTDTGKKFQLANVKDVNYRTEETPSESENVNNNHAYEYDANGNLVYVNTSRTKKDGVADEKTAERKLKWDEENRLLASDDNGFVTNYWYDANGNLVYVNTSRTKKDGMTDEKAAERKLKWDEENRLLASDDNGFVTNYWYDADGERTVKTSGESDQVYVNSEFAGGRTNTAKFSLYVSPYLVANQGGRYTKHIYIGSQRVVSKIGDFDSYGSDPRRIQYAGSETDGLSVDYKVKYTQQLQVIKDNYATFAVPYNGEDNNDYVDGKGFCCNDGSLEAAQARAMAANTAKAKAANGNFKENDDYEKMQFYYHPDHLGSSSYITNLDGEVVQHIEYVPFGEVFVEERNNIWNTPYLFNAKEFDEETGLYYYGARYYDPRVSLWISVDSQWERYPNVSGYSFSLNNPIKFIDTEGHEPVTAIADAMTAFVVEVGLDFVSNMVLKDMTPRQALNSIHWGNAAAAAAQSYAVSLVISGIGSARALSKVANSKIGHVVINFTASVTNSLMQDYKNGIFNDSKGNFSFAKVKSRMLPIIGEALVSALINEGFTKKAKQIEAKLDKLYNAMQKQEHKLQENLSRNVSEKVLVNRMKKVNNSQKAFLKQLGKYGGFSSAQQSLSGGLGKYTGHKLEEKK